jgi:hypothetical protein
MSELAFNANGDNFEIPAIVTGWRVRRMKPRGAPELVYGRDGRPLTVPIESDMEDLRDAVGGVLGKYRLDPINDDAKIIESVPAAYIQVVKAERAVEAAAGPAQRDESDSLLREAMRHNTELAKSVIDRFPEMMQAAAELLRAADGAGLPSRKPREIEVEDEEDEAEDELESATPPGFDLNALVAQLVPMLVTGLMSGKMKLPGLAAMLDWRKAKPSNDSATAPESAPNAKPHAKPALPQVAAPAQEPPSDAALPVLDPAAMVQVVAIQSALEPQEVAFVQEVAKELSPAELRAWFDKLSKLSVPDAVEVIRGLIAGKDKNGGAS